jgi:hypothetical protein
MLHIQNKIPLTGHLKVTLCYPDGREETHFEEDNLIVYGGKSLMLQALYSSTFVVDPISTLHVGTGGTIDPQGTTPKVPTTDLTSLYTNLMSVATTYSVVSSSIPSVTFLASISETQGNGSQITEAGLFTASGVMFNIKTFTGIPKSSSFAINFAWTISVL